MIRQLYYTSCRHGRDGIQGFQVAAATPGVPGRHEDLGLPLAAYRPPPSAPAVPSPAEVAALPVAFGFRDFGEVAVLFRSHYLGEDFTGRQGNYFAHLLLLDRPGRDLAGIVPAATWEAAFWARGAVGEGAGTTLPPVPDLGPADGAGGDRIREWITARPADFAALLAAVRDGLAGRLRRVVVVADGPDPAAEVAAAVAAVTATLPAPLHRGVSFTTFCAAPDDVGVLVAGTTPDVALGAHERDRAVLRLGAAPPTPPSAFGTLAGDRWRAGPQAVAALHQLAAQIRPPLTADELDAFAVAVPLLDETAPPDGDGTGDLLAGLEFLADRHPRALVPRVWERVEAAVVSGQAPVEDLDRWSAVLARTTGRRQVLESAYLRAVLGRLALGSGTDELWMPAVDADAGDGTVAWAVAAVGADPQPATALRVLRALHRLGVEPPEADLQQVSDLVLLPLALDPDGDVGPFLALPDAARLARVMAEQLEGRLDDELVTVVAEGMTVAAAQWLADAAVPRGRVALATALRLAAEGRRDAVDLVVSHAADAAGLDRLVALVWRGAPPTVAQGLRLLARLDPRLVAAGAVPAVLAASLPVDAASDDPDPDAEELARRLLSRTDALPERARADVEAVLVTAWFRRFPLHDAQAPEQVRVAARAGRRADPVLARPLVRTLVHRLFDTDVVRHAETLDVLVAAGTRGVLRAYTDRLLRAVKAGEPPDLLRVLPALAHLSARWPEIDELLTGPCAEALARRRRKVLDQVGVRLGEPRSVPPALRPGRETTWTAWWKDYRDTRITPAEPGLRDRLPRFGRSS